MKLSYDRFHDFERTMAINYFGAVRLVLALLPQMVERRFGSATVGHIREMTAHRLVRQHA